VIVASISLQTKPGAEPTKGQVLPTPLVVVNWDFPATTTIEK